MGKYKLNERTIARLCEALELGATYELASQYAGISYPTLRRWIREGETGENAEMRELVDRIHEAEAEAVAGALRAINEASKAGTWQAGAWLLERRYPESYGLRRKDNPNKTLSEQLEEIEAVWD